MDVFLQTCDWLEDRVCVHSLRDFMEKMREYAGKDDLEVYHKRYTKKLLQRLYERHITFSEETGKPTLIILQEIATYQIQEKYAETKTNIDYKKRRIITMAAPPRWSSPCRGEGAYPPRSSRVRQRGELN